MSITRLLTTGCFLDECRIDTLDTSCWSANANNYFNWTELASESDQKFW